MPAIEYFLVCRSVQTDATTNEMSFINVLEDISPEAFPTTIPRAIAVSLWNLRPEELEQDYQAMLVVKVPGRKPVPFAMNLSTKTTRCRAIQVILDIPVDREGDIEFEVLLNNEHAATHIVRIHPVGVGSTAENGEPLA